MAVSHRLDRRSPGTRRLPIWNGGAVLGATRGEFVDRAEKLARGSGTAQRNQFNRLDLPLADRLDVVPGLPVEAAAAGLGRVRVLDRANGRARSVRVSPCAGQDRIPAEPDFD